MIITNKLNLPPVFEKAVQSDHDFVENRYSCTELLLPNQEIKLRRKHYNEIEVDIMDCIPSLIGSAVHKYLEELDNGDDETEIKMEMEIGKFVLSGRCDVLNKKNKTIKDYKVTKTNTVIKNDFDQYYKQGMIYAYMQYFKYGNKIEKLEFYLILKDWSKLKTLNSANYPQNPVYKWEYQIKDSDYIFIEKFIKNKLNSLTENTGCSNEDTWYTGDKFAVYKNESDKRATILCETYEEAKGYVINKLKGSGIIVPRYGERLKCKYYCEVSKYCSQYNKKED